MLGLVAVLHGLAWGDARTPLLVADDTGLRVRLGGDWTGVPWAHVERVEVDERGRVSDGHVAVIAAEAADELADARWRSRLGAAAEPLVLRRLARRAVRPDHDRVRRRMCRRHLERLAAGRAPDRRPRRGARGARADGRDHDARPTTPTSTEVQPAGVTSRPRRRADLSAARGRPRSAAEARPRCSSHPANASDGLRFPSVVSTLAAERRVAMSSPYPEQVNRRHAGLSSPSPSTRTPKQLTETSRRSAPRATTRTHRRRPSPTAPIGNVGLIIDATTDLSARAMSKVRRAAPLATSAELLRDQPIASPDRDAEADVTWSSAEPSASHASGSG